MRAKAGDVKVGATKSFCGEWGGEGHGGKLASARRLFKLRDLGRDASFAGLGTSVYIRRRGIGPSLENGLQNT